MLDDTAGVLVAVSGGADSVVLLDILSTLRTEKPRIHVAHLDHMLRGRESAEDAEFVRGLADSLGLDSTIRSIDVGAVAKACGGGIEEMARELRYGFLLEAALEAGCDRIAVGHTMTDQAETFLMRLVRGAGLRGLAAMRPVSAAPVFRQRPAEYRVQSGDDEYLPSAFSLLPSDLSLPPSVLLIRPLLCLTREDVEEYCAQRGLEFRTDSTNQDARYTRNQIRNEVFPGLKILNPRIVEAIGRAAENLAGDQEVLDRLASSLLEETRLATENGRNNNGAFAFSVTGMRKQHTAMRRRMIIEAINLVRSRVALEIDDIDAHEVTSVHVAAVERLLKPSASGKQVALPGGLDVWREFDALVFKPRARQTGDSHLNPAISSASPATEAFGFAFTLERSQPADVLTATIEETQLEAQRTGSDWMRVALDDERLPESLLIRARLPGERAQVVGHQKLIKLKNLMIDHRIPSSRRANWPIVTTPDGCYVWSPGLPPALKFAARDGTKRIAIMRASAT